MDVDNFEHVLKMSTHNDALYAYYYTDNSTNHVKVTEIFDFDEMTENGELQATDLQLYEGSVEDHPNPRQQHSHNAVVSEWNGVESGKYQNYSIYLLYLPPYSYINHTTTTRSQFFTVQIMPTTPELHDVAF